MMKNSFGNELLITLPLISYGKPYNIVIIKYG